MADTKRRKSGDRSSRTPSLQRIIRVNWRVAVGIVAVLAVGALAVYLLSGWQRGRLRDSAVAASDAMLAEGQRDAAIQNLYRFLDQSPNDPVVLAKLADLIGENPQSGDQMLEAARLNERLLVPGATGPETVDRRRKIARFYLDYTTLLRADSKYRLLPPENVVSLDRSNVAKQQLDEVRRQEGDSPTVETARLLARYEELQLGSGEKNLDSEAVGRVEERYREALRLDPKDFETASRFAAFYLTNVVEADKEKALARALEVTDQAVAADPDRARPRLLRYRILREMGREGESREELRKIAESMPDDDDLRVTLVEESLLRRDTESARLQFKNLPEAIRTSSLGRRLEAFIELSEGHPDEAMILLKDGLLASGGTDLNAAADLLELYLQLNRVNEARPLLERIRRIVPNPKDPLILLYEARRDILAGRAADALATLEALRANEGERLGDRNMERVLIALAQAQLANGLTDQAIATYEDALARNPGSIAVRDGLVRALLGNDPTRALKVVQDGLAATPDSLSLRLLAAEVQLRIQARKPAAERDWTQFEAALARVEEIAPNNSGIPRLKAERLAQQGDTEGTLRQLEEIARQSPRSLEPWLLWSGYLTAMGQPVQALKVVDEAIKPEGVGDRVELRIARARLLLALNRGREAREAVTRDIDALSPSQQAEAWRLLGDLSASRGEYKDARTAYERWSRLDPDNYQPLYILLEDALRDGDAAEADKVLARLEDVLKTSDTAADSADTRKGGTDHYLYKLAAALKESRIARPGTDPAQRVARAEQLVDEVLAEAPNLGNAHLLKGDLLVAQDKRTEALDSYRKALNVGAAAALPRLIELLIAAADYRRELIENLPRVVGRYETSRLAAEAAVRQKKPVEAIYYAEKTERDHPNAPEVQLWKSRILAAIGPNDAAEQEAQALVDQKPGELDNWLKLIRLKAAKGKPADLDDIIKAAQAKVTGQEPEVIEFACRRVANDLAGADRAIRAAMAAHPEDNEIALLASSFFQETNQIALAGNALRDILRRDPDHRAAARALAVNLAARATTVPAWEEAWATLGPEPEGDSATIEERLARAVVLARSADPDRRDDGIKRLEELLVDLPPDLTTASASRDELILALIRSKNYDRACELAALSARRSPSVSTFLIHAEALIEAGRKDEAREPLDRVSAVLPSDPREAALRLRLLWDPADVEGSADAIEKAFRARADADAAAAEGFGLVAVTTLETGGPKSAPHAMRIARRLAQSNPGLSWIVARQLEREGKPAEALESCAAAVKYGRTIDAQEASRLAALIAFQNDDPSLRSRAAEIIEEARGRYPNDAELRASAALLHHVLGRYREEVAAYQEILAESPSSYLALNNIAWAYCEGLKDYDEALRHVNRALDLYPDDPSLLDTRGVIHTRKGDHDQAIRDLEKSIELTAERDPKNVKPPIRCFHLARALAAKGDQAGAKRWLDEAIAGKLDPAQLESFERPEFEALRQQNP